MANSKSHSEWELDESAAMRLPVVTVQDCLSGFGFTADLSLCIIIKRGVSTVTDVTRVNWSNATSTRWLLKVIDSQTGILFRVAGRACRGQFVECP